MSEIRPFTNPLTLAGYYQQLLNHIIVVRLSINANAKGHGDDLPLPVETQLLTRELADELEKLRGDAAVMITALRQSVPIAASKQAGL